MKTLKKIWNFMFNHKTICGKQWIENSMAEKYGENWFTEMIDGLENPEVKKSVTNILQLNKNNIKISEIIALRNRINEICSLNLTDINFIDDDGNKIDIDTKIIEEFKYTGLNNTDFIVSGFYKNGFNEI